MPTKIGWTVYHWWGGARHPQRCCHSISANHAICWHCTIFRRRRRRRCRHVLMSTTKCCCDGEDPWTNSPTVGSNMAAASLLGIVAAKLNKKISRNLTDENRNSVMNNHDTIRMVQGRKWSMIVYQSCRLKGQPLARAWKHAFVE